MNSDLPDLKAAMLDRIRAAVPRKVWTPSDFVDLASRDAVDKALQRLTKAETLRRIDRGLYDQPGFNKLTQRPNRPILVVVLKDWVTETKETPWASNVSTNLGSRRASGSADRPYRRRSRRSVSP